MKFQRKWRFVYEGPDIHWHIFIFYANLSYIAERCKMKPISDNVMPIYKLDDQDLITDSILAS